MEANGVVFRKEAFEGAVRRVVYALTPLTPSRYGEYPVLA